MSGRVLRDRNKLKRVVRADEATDSDIDLAANENAAVKRPSVQLKAKDEAAPCPLPAAASDKQPSHASSAHVPTAAEGGAVAQPAPAPSKSVIARAPSQARIAQEPEAISACGGLTRSYLAYAGGSFPLPPAGAKRDRPWRGQPSGSTRDRISRANQQRMFLVDRRSAGSQAVDFDVLGSTGNVYHVRVGPAPSCNCPDFPRSGCCKHIIFIFCKVLQVPKTHPLVWQVAYLPNELQYVFAHAPDPTSGAMSSVLAPDAAREAVAQLTGQPGLLPTSAAAAVPAVPAAATKPHDPADDCPVCYDALGAAAAALLQCSACKQHLHAECMREWLNNKRKSGQESSCVFCRAAWKALGEALPQAASASGAGVTLAAESEDGYVNVAALAGLSSERPMGTYYNGPRRGWYGRGYYGRGYDY